MLFCIAAAGEVGVAAGQKAITAVLLAHCHNAFGQAEAARLVGLCAQMLCWEIGLRLSVNGSSTCLRASSGIFPLVWVATTNL